MNNKIEDFKKMMKDDFLTEPSLIKKERGYFVVIWHIDSKGETVKDKAKAGKSIEHHYDIKGNLILEALS